MYTNGNDGRLSIFIFLPQHCVFVGSKTTGLKAVLPLLLKSCEFKSRCNSEGYLACNSLTTVLQSAFSVKRRCFPSFRPLQPWHTDGVAVLISNFRLRTNSATSSYLLGVPSGKWPTAKSRELNSSWSTTIAHISRSLFTLTIDQLQTTSDLGQVLVSINVILPLPMTRLKCFRLGHCQFNTSHLLFKWYKLKGAMNF